MKKNEINKRNTILEIILKKGNTNNKQEQMTNKIKKQRKYTLN